MKTISPAGLAFITAREGERLQSYRDTAGIWTVGVGHTPANAGEVITQDQSDTFLMMDLGRAIMEVNRDCPIATQNQFDAMVSLAFNIGIGGFRSSSVARYHRAGEYTSAAPSFLLWDKDHHDGNLVVVPGLLKRRQLEEALYNTADAVLVPAGTPTCPA